MIRSSYWQACLRLGLPVVSIMAVVILINLFTLQTPQRFDLTTTGVYSISKETRRAITAVQEPIEIIFFYDLRSKEMTDARALVEQYASLSDKISVRAIDPQLQPAEARRYKVLFAGTSIFKSEGRQVVVNGGAETDFTNGLIRVSMQAKQRICFTDGHIESDPFSLKTHDHMEGDMQSHGHSTGGRVLEINERHGMGMAKDALETLGYEVKKIVLAQGPGQLDGCAVVVAAAPQKKFQANEVQEFERYMTEGGNAVVMLEPYIDSGLASLLAAYGVALEPGTVIDNDRHYWTDPATPAVSEYPRHEITRHLALSFFPGAASLVPAPDGFQHARVQRLVETSDQARVDILQGDKSGADVEGRRVLMLESTRNNQRPGSSKSGELNKSRLVVIGDGDFATNSYYHILGNGALFLNAVNVLAGENRLVNIQPRNYEMPMIRLTNGQMALTFFASTILLPLLLSLLGGFIWWRRRTRE
jgi:ABC-type uncharacterized transport system involved in gliding motility auxiliary subunit